MEDTPTVECSMCGRDGYPPAACGLCHGRAKPQSRAMTLSEETVERRKDPDRYKRDGAISPKIVNMPGSDPTFGN